MRRQNGCRYAAGLLLGLALCVGRASPLFGAASPDDFDDRWLSVMAMEELARGARQGDWAGLEKRAQTLITQRLSCGHLDKMQALNDLVYVQRACRYLAMADRLEPTRKFSTWLAANRDVSRLLFRALQDVTSPEDSLGRFQSLLAADDKRVLAYANLAVALATSQPLVHYVKQPNPASMLDNFAWFTNAKVAFRYDLKAMPYELSRYFADTRLSLAERQWVAQGYSGRANLEGTYHSIKFDMDYYFRGAPKKITRVDYTLANILKVGGVCIDQAYFASEICKTLGVPSTIVMGHNTAGSGHAWVASLKMFQAGGRMTVEWDASTGRYEQQKFYTGTLADPASQKKIHDSELALLGAAALLPLDRREEADAATALAAMIVPLAKSAFPGGVDELKKLAEDYNRNAAPGSKAPNADLLQIAAVRKIDFAMVENLLVEAANHNLAHQQVWDLVIELRKAGSLSTECLDRLFDLLVTRTAKAYPDYSCHMILQITLMIDSPVRRESIYLKCLDMYRDRPDLQGQLIVARGDDLAGQGKKEQAFKVYQQLMFSKPRELTEVLVMAAQHAEDLLLADNRRDAAIKMYSQLFADLRKPRVDGGYPQSAYYLVGKRLAELLTEAGQKDAAQRVYKDIGSGFEPALKA